MNSFKNCYKGEMYKISRKKTYLKMIIALIVILGLILAVYTLLDKAFDMAGLDNGLPSSFNSNEEAIDYYKYKIDEYEQNIKYGSIKQIGVAKSKLAEYKAGLAKYEYLQEKGLSDAQFDDLGGLGDASAGNFTLTAISSLAQIISIFAIVMAAKNLTVEKNNGTLKMQLIRPNSRTTIFTAKHLAVLTASLIFLIGGTIVAQVIGVLKFGASSKTMLAVLDSKYVFQISPFGAVALLLAISVIQIIAFIQLTYFISMISKGKNAPLVLGLLMVLIGSVVESFLAYLGVGYIGFVSNLELFSAFTLQGAPMNGMYLWTMLSITIAYIVLMVVTNYFVFNKQDIN